MKIIISTSVLSTILLLSASASAAEIAGDSTYGLTAKVGTLGLGLDLTHNINSKLNARFNINGGSLDADGEEDGVNYKGTLDALTIGALLDYHPFSNGFRLSAGLYKNNNELNLDASGDTSANIGGTVYNLGTATVNTKVDFKRSIAPYLGLGWGNAVKKTGKWSFNLDAGVLFQGKPKAKMTSSGVIGGFTIGDGSAASNTYLANVAQEELDLNNELDDIKAYPVLSLGLGYTF